MDTTNPAHGAGADETDGARLIDVRRAAAFQQSDAMLAGAEWRDPAQVEAWAAEVAQSSRGLAVIVYCVHGHEVSQTTAARLRVAGVDARFLVGGIEAWRADGRPVVAKPGR
jgi:Fe-Mn family superoxide dismutase